MLRLNSCLAITVQQFGEGGKLQQVEMLTLLSELGIG